jgi:predicted PurR-regulated permease PerM
MMSKTLGVNPLLVFVCMLFGGLIMGFFGILLSVPIAVIFSIVFKLPDKPQTQSTKEKPTLKAKK